MRKRDEASRTALPNERDGSKDIGDAKFAEKLTAKEFQVLRQKSTEPPNSGSYNNFYEDGEYYCKACDTLLYTSDMKFQCGCGWPGFWTNAAKAVREEPDSDGQRVEILCNACNSHLGHVFRGEGFKNPLNERHCVNSICLRFVARAALRR